jgi:hypothetical protein
MGWVVNATPRRLYRRERKKVPTVREARWAPVPVWTGAENLAPNGIRSPDSPARSGSLYRLRYPGPYLNAIRIRNFSVVFGTPFTEFVWFGRNLSKETVLTSRLFWEVKLCRWPSISRRFETSQCLHLQGHPSWST